MRARHLLTLAAQEARHHPGRIAVALLAVALGVALAFAVHLINASALAEFGQAVRTVNGQPDLELRAAGGRDLDEALYTRVAALAAVAQASPVIEIDTVAIDASGRKRALKLIGQDLLVAATLAPALLPRPDPARGADLRLAGLDPRQVFLNPAAQQLLGVPAGGRLRLQSGNRIVALTVGGTVAAEAAPLAVIDIAGAQAFFGRPGRISRIDLRLAPGADRAGLLAVLGPGVRAAAPDEAAQRVSNLSQAYRVNLTVLALVALFTGAFLVFSVQSQAVAKRVPQLALLGVLGMTGRERLALVLLESALLGLAGAAAGLALGTGLALLALRVLGGDLGSGLLGGSAPALQWSDTAAWVYGGLGLLAALAGGWQPAQRAARLAPAQSLKGLGGEDLSPRRPWLGPLLLVLGVALAFAPPWRELPLGAYAAVALLLVGGIATVPLLVGAVLGRRAGPRQPVLLLAVERARDQRDSAAITVAGVVASLALSVALTVMVASFRDSVTGWLEEVLPADLYARTAATAAQADGAYLEPAFLRAAAALPGVARVQAQRVVPIELDPARAPLALIARELGDARRTLPLVGEPVEAGSDGLPELWASEGAVALYGLSPGRRVALPLPDGRRVEMRVRGVWRDYARQQGSLAIDRAAWQRLSGDERINDLALWLAPGADLDAVRRGLRALTADAALLEIATPAEIRATSLAIFDRSFAVTYWLQAVAIVIGLFGIAASFSSQVLARRREFGALQHLGMDRRQVLALVCAEGAVWTGFGALLGLALGLAVSVVLVHVVNPQSFHWTMDMALPWGRLAALAVAVLVAGTLTAWIAGRAAASREMALAVKEDW
ncbi:FtsX-like permease family protein [Sphaerotilus uruguayifluvii]|uniref:ABC transport system permease protein n=1 Tax=Sphaerotilus uruguayifluvii TaxID=2735897 RepID=A0ABX2G310_9BURK|nr:FtsX-like permease family protein [Leptothrix sp. C29]NRT56688.1 putative ABC transport system permease protein [Leptothrix sp. C29]